MLQFTNHSVDNNGHDLKLLLEAAISDTPGQSSNINHKLLKYKL